MQLGDRAVVAVLVDDTGGDVDERARTGDVLDAVEHDRELPLDDPIQLVALVHVREGPHPPWRHADAHDPRGLVVDEVDRVEVVDAQRRAIEAADVLHGRAKLDTLAFARQQRSI